MQANGPITIAGFFKQKMLNIHKVMANVQPNEDTDVFALVNNL